MRSQVSSSSSARPRFATSRSRIFSHFPSARNVPRGNFSSAIIALRYLFRDVRVSASSEYPPCEASQNDTSRLSPLTGSANTFNENGPRKPPRTDRGSRDTNEASRAYNTSEQQYSPY